MVSGELENSLRAEVDKYIDSRLSGLQEEIARLQAQVNEAFTRLTDVASSNSSSGGEQVDATGIEGAISRHIHAAHERGIEDAAAESPRTKASSDMAILKAAIEEVSEQHSQTEILKTLVNRAASFAPRVAFFVVKNQQAVGWRARGLEGTVGDEAVRDITLPLSADTPLSDVVRSRTTWSGAPGSNAEDYLLLNKLGSDPPQRMIAIPLVARGRAAAVLYADSAALDSDAINLEALETLMRVAGMAVELTATSPQARAAAPAGQHAAQPATPEPAVEAHPATVEPQTYEPSAEPPPAERWEERAHETPSVEPEATTLPDSAYASSPAYTPAQATIGEETLVREAPAMPVEMPAQESTSTEGQAAAPLAGARRYGRAADAAELPVEVASDDERRLHTDARRFARLLVSEIKLYNEQKVKEGRLEGDIYERLREDIDRSRQMYDKRVAPPVAARYDYFHQELVNTLAEGDQSKLGSGYPGATV